MDTEKTLTLGEALGIAWVESYDNKVLSPGGVQPFIEDRDLSYLCFEWLESHYDDLVDYDPMYGDIFVYTILRNKGFSIETIADLIIETYRAELPV